MVSHCTQHSEIDSFTSSVSKKINAWKNLTSATDANGATTTTGYDMFGRRAWVKTPLDQGYAATALYTYTLGTVNMPTKVEVNVRRDPGGAATADYQKAWYFLDGLGRVIQNQTLGLANGSQARIVVVNTAYDPRGKLWRVSQPYYVNVSANYAGTYQTPPWTANTYFTYAYDAIGRTLTVTNPDNTFTTTTYNHRLTTTTNANGDSKDFLADAFGRTTRVSEYNQGSTYTTQYGYDLLDRLTATTDNANNLTTLTYDWLGRKTAMQDPDMGTWTYAYDNAGNLTEQHDARGNSVCFGYDNLNRATTKTARTGTSCVSSPIQYSVTFGYDDTTSNNKGLGRRTSLSDSFGSSQAWKYDLQGRVLSTAQTIPGAPATYTTAFSYDAMDRVRTMTYPDGEVVTSAYNNQGLPLNLVNNDPTPITYATANTYNAASQLTQLTFGNNAVTNYTYNPQNLRLTDIVTTKSGNTLLNLHYGFDNVGNILSVVDNARGETTNYGYDDLNRLLTAGVTTGGNPYSRSWTYDSIGNITQRVENGATTTYQYNDTSSKHAVTHLNNVLKYAYDPNGNMTTRDGDTLAYDVENRLTQVVKGSITTNFAYNGDGTRVKREVVGTGTTYYIGNYYEVWVPNGGTTTFNKFYYFGAQRVAAKIAGTLFYFQGDHLGSSSIVMTQAGTSFYTRQTYFPYGAQRTTEGSALPTDYTFTGQKNDDSTGLMFYGARYYDVSLGRFIQADMLVPSPLNPQSLNRFAYVYNNPVRYTDPTGHTVPCDVDPECGQPGNWTPPPANTGGNPYPDNGEGDCNLAGCTDLGASNNQNPSDGAGVAGDAGEPDLGGTATGNVGQSPTTPEEAQGSPGTTPQPRYSFGTGRTPVCVAGGCVNWNLSFWVGNPESPLTVSSVGWLNATSGCGLTISNASVSCNPGGNASMGSTEFGIPGGKTKLNYYAGIDYGTNGLNPNAGIKEAVVFPGAGNYGFGIAQDLRVSKSMSNEDIAGGAALATLPIYFASRGFSWTGGLSPEPAPAGIMPFITPNQNEWY